MQADTLAAHRFGFAETSLAALRADPQAWVRGQFRNPAPRDDQGLASALDALQLGRRVVQAAVTTRAQAALGALPASADDERPVSELQPARRELRQANGRALQRRWQHVIATPTPVYERWVMFWANHFSVAATKGSTLGLVAPFEREAIRPHALGTFAMLLRAATLHPAMLLYLDNAQSIGPNSRAGQRRDKGLNENLARELLELHTLGVQGGYTQADVIALARLLTGWTVARDGESGPGGAEPGTSPGINPGTRFHAAWHEPGPKRVLGRTYREGPDAVDALFTDLARHPSTARFVAGRLARHFVSDTPPPALVDAVAARFTDTQGDLLAVADALFSHPLAWQADARPKFKRPEELLLSAHRLLKLPMVQAERSRQALVAMGQAVGRAPSPAGWPDRSEDWLAPDALWKRVEWAGRFAAEHAGMADARALGDLSFGRDLGDPTRQQIARADSGAQALALLLASPEFQRR